MKIEQTANDVVLSNVTDQGEFRIKNSAKAFSILSSGLYSNKIKAIVRELSCNAWDSHKEAGKEDVPFECHLPTVIEPYFSIKDFGIGLDDKGVTQIYTTYFESTKSDSNDYIGALGLGSKSPFSYTDNFTVTAIKDGMSRIYTAYINDQGVPAIALMAESETEDGNGVEVSFPVICQSDFSRFNNEAVEVYRWFPVFPTLTGKQIDLERHAYQEKDIAPGIHVSVNNSRTCRAVQGNIAYRINIPGELDDFEHLQHVMAAALVIEFEIGELDVAANREELSYIPLTLNNIKKKLEIAAEAMSDFVQKEVDAISGPWEKMLRLNELVKTKVFEPTAIKIINDQFADISVAYGRYDRWAAIDIATNEIHADLNVKFLRFHTTYGKKASYKEFRGSGYSYDDLSYKVPIDDEIVVVTNDSTRKALSRVRAHYLGTANQPKTIIYIDASRKDPQRQKKIDKFLKQICSPPVVLVTSLTETLKVARDKIASTSVVKMVANSEAYRNRSQAAYNVSDVSPSDIDDVNETYYYVPINGYSITDDRVPGLTTKIKYEAYHHTSMIVSRNMSEFTQFIRDLGYDMRVYGVRKRAWDTAAKASNWVNIMDFLADEFALLDAELVYKPTLREHLSGNSSIFCSEVIEAFASLPKGHKLRTLVTAAGIEHADISGNLVPLFRKKAAVANELFNANLDLDSVKERAYNYYKDAIASYPMFELVSFSYSEPKPQLLLDYIELIDGEKK